MALLTRLFQGRKSNKSTRKWTSSEVSNKWSCPNFERGQIRLVIFGDNDLRGRLLLFDSKAIHRVDEMTKPESMFVYKSSSTRKMDPDHAIIRPAPKYHYTKPSSDIKMLEEMMFGSVAMVYQGSTLKVHLIRAPGQIMLTKVFQWVKKRDSIGETELLDSYSLNGLSNELTSPRHIMHTSRSSSNIAQSIPVDVPPPKIIEQIMDDDSGLASASITSSGSFPHSGSNSFSSSSYNSLHRRWLRNQTTSIEGYLRKRSSEEMLRSCDYTPRAQRHEKISIGILFSFNKDTESDDMILFQKFFFSHITLFEGHLEKLKTSVERALYNKRSFVHIVMEAMEVFQENIYDLYAAPRLSEPVWLNMMAYASYRYVICQQFMKEFMTLVAKYDNKNTHFFVSTVLTAVLTYHLAWVPTVTPAGGTPSSSYLDKHSAKWLNTLAKTHPYNPLWAQLGDMYGAISYPLKLSRTVITGKKSDIVNKLLYILSYFIRCSEVQESSSSASLLINMDDIGLSMFEQSMSDNERGVVNSGSVSTTGGSGGGASGTSTIMEEDRQSRSSVIFIPDSVSSPVFSNSGSVQSGSTNVTLTSGDSSCVHVTGDKSSDNISNCTECSSCSKLDTTSQRDSQLTNTYDDVDGAVMPEVTKCRCSSDSVNNVCDNNAIYDGVSDNVRTLNRLHISDSQIPYMSSEELCSCQMSHVHLDGEHLRDASKSISFDETLESDSVCNTCSMITDTVDTTSREDFICDSLPVLRVPLEKDTTCDTGFLTEGVQVCRVLKAVIEDSFRIENERLVSKSNDMSWSLGSEARDGAKSPSGSVKGRSVLSEQLAFREKHKEPSSSSDKSAFKQQFLKDGSISMFDEYFDENVELKTIDDLDDKEKDMIRPLLERTSSFSHKREDSTSVGGSLSSRLTLSTESKTTIGSDDSTSMKLNLSSKPVVSRQCSIDRNSYVQGGRSSVLSTGPARCRSITPTELGRRRHLSSTSSFDLDPADPLTFCKNIPLPSIATDCSSSQPVKNIQSFDSNFGRSLLAAHSDHYLSDFVLHGTSDPHVKHKVIHDLNASLQHPVLDEPISEAVCIIADTDKWIVEVMSSRVVPDRPPATPWIASHLVCNLVESVHDLWKLKMSPEFCLMHLEDRLQEIFFKSRMLSVYARNSSKTNMKELKELLGLDPSDLPLLLAIATTQSVNIALGVV